MPLIPKLLLDKVSQLGEKYLGGHISLGPVTIFGFNSMHGQVDIKTKSLGYVCICPPTYMFGTSWPAQFYISPNATPQSSTFLLGKEYTKPEKIAAIRRWILWGHNYNTKIHHPFDERELFDDYIEGMMHEPSSTDSTYEQEKRSRRPGTTH